jgi:two-component system sensor kinase FixL
VGLSQNGIQTRLALDPAATPVLADRVQIEQVLVNLIRNAAEAMADSPVRELTISSAIEGQQWCGSPSPTPAPGSLKRSLPSFFRPSSSTKTDGMGLGLSICRTIVEAHGGKIWVNTPPGDGTRFHFTLMHIVSEDGDDG